MYLMSNCSNARHKERLGLPFLVACNGAQPSLRQFMITRAYLRLMCCPTFQVASCQAKSAVVPIGGARAAAQSRTERRLAAPLQQRPGAHGAPPPLRATAKRRRRRPKRCSQPCTPWSVRTHSPQLDPTDCPPPASRLPGLQCRLQVVGVLAWFSPPNMHFDICKVPPTVCSSPVQAKKKRRLVKH